MTTNEIELLSAEQQKHSELERYIEEDGTFCPFCGSEKLDWKSLEFDDLYPTQKVFCRTCGREWEDEYKIINFYWVQKDDG
jgi:RNA polymerase subunit RPABC4/transcription elongation factor Spt4